MERTVNIPDNYKLAYHKRMIEKNIAMVGRELNTYSRYILESTGKPVIFLCVLEGGLFFYSDLLKHISSNQVETAFCKIITYHGKVKLPEPVVDLPFIDLEGRTVVIVDDILDTGDTLNLVHDTLLKDSLEREVEDIIRAKAIRAAVLIHRVRKNNYLAFDVHTYRAIEYEGEEWFVGYGMDDYGLNRNLMDIYIKEE